MDKMHPLTTYRSIEHLTQEELAKRLAVAPHTVWRWENRKRVPRIREAKKIAELTGISVSTLIEAGVDQ